VITEGSKVERTSNSIISNSDERGGVRKVLGKSSSLLWRRRKKTCYIGSVGLKEGHPSTSKWVTEEMKKEEGERMD